MFIKWFILSLTWLMFAAQGAHASPYARLEQLERATQSAYAASASDSFHRHFKELLNAYKDLGFAQEEIWTLRRYGYHTTADLVETQVLETLSRGAVSRAEFMEPDSSISQLTFENGWKAIFRPGSIFKSVAEMDILAFEVDRALGFDLVPLTTVRQHEGHLGSVQLFIGASKSGMVNFIVHPYSNRKMHILDFITQQLDRHETNWLIRPGGYEVAIDNNMVYGTEAWRLHKVVLAKYSAQSPPEALTKKERQAIETLKTKLQDPTTSVYRAADTPTRAALLEKIEALLTLPPLEICENRLISGL